ncbi:hypothetical protein P9X10_01045 [Bacillus cereus]|nr:hypothetical protein [Bacillus cereus]
MGFNLDKVKRIALRKEPKMVCLSIISACGFVLANQGYRYKSVYLDSLDKDVVQALDLTETNLFLLVSYLGIFVCCIFFIVAMLLLDWIERSRSETKFQLRTKKRLFLTVGTIFIFSPVIASINLAGKYRLNDFAFLLLVGTGIVFAIIKGVSERNE